MKTTQKAPSKKNSTKLSVDQKSKKVTLKNKAIKASKPLKRGKKGQIDDPELEEVPVLDPTHSHEDHEILSILEKKPNKPKISSVDYIPELERGDFDIVE